MVENQTTMQIQKRELTPEEKEEDSKLFFTEMRYSDYYRKTRLEISLLKFKIKFDAQTIKHYEEEYLLIAHGTDQHRAYRYKITHNKTRVERLIAQINYQREYGEVLRKTSKRLNELFWIEYGKHTKFGDVNHRYNSTYHPFKNEGEKEVSN